MSRALLADPQGRIVSSSYPARYPLGGGLLGETMFAAQSVESFTDRVGFVLTSHGPSPSQEERSWRRAGPNANPAARRRPRRYANGRAGRLSLSAWPRRAARPWWVPAREPTRRCRAAT